jgi:uncharacterized membrane protein (UPF0127 family)
LQDETNLRNELHHFRNKTRGTSIADQAVIAKSFFSRAKGLLGTDSLASGAGLFLVPCNSIHMFGMRYAIDAIFLDKNLVVVEILHAIQPGKASRLYPKAYSCLEVPAGRARETATEIGDQIEYALVPGKS